MAQVYFCLLNQLRLIPGRRSTGLDAGPAPNRKLEVRGWDGRGHTHRGPLAHPKGTLCPPTVLLHGAQARQMAAGRQNTLLGPLWLGSCGFPTANCPSADSSKPTRWEPACPGTYTALSQESCLRLQRSFPWGGTRQPSSVSLQSEAATQCPRPCKGTQPGVRRVQEHGQAREGSSSSLPSHCWFSRDTCWGPVGRTHNGVLPALPVTQGLSLPSHCHS